ncbi:MAG TPA: hypothetical protein VND93_32550, partial [Myxococcales bacterium]|nr:hypothetical protein [Myxococcales bacterium]
MSSARAATLATDGTMEPVEGTVEVGVPIDELWRMFARPSLWPWWNRCFSLALNRTLELGASLLWVFQPIRWWMPYRMPAVARIVELQQEGPRRLVTWEVTALPGFYARHTYFMESRGPWRTRFGSTEKAMGWSFRALRAFWVAHFTFVKDRSLEGARALERVFQRDRRLDTTTVKPRSALPAALGWAGAAALVAALAAAAWFYASFVRQQVVDL